MESDEIEKVAQLQFLESRKKTEPKGSEMTFAPQGRNSTSKHGTMWVWIDTQSGKKQKKPEKPEQSIETPWNRAFLDGKRRKYILLTDLTCQKKTAPESGKSTNRGS